VVRLIIRKLALIIVLVPLLNAFGFFYANTFGPRRFVNAVGRLVERESAPAFFTMYGAYLKRVLAGDLGAINRVAILEYIATPLKNSLALLGLALLLVLLLGPVLGLLAVQRDTGRIGPRAQLVLTVGSALPGFFLGSVLIAAILYGSRYLYWGSGTFIPIQGFGLDAHLIVPTLTLAVRPILYVAYITAGLLEHELQQDYVRVALGKGLSWRRLLWRHTLPNIAAPVLIAQGQSLRFLVSGLILVEALFDWRGMGRMFMQTIALNSSLRASSIFLHAELLAFIFVLFGGLLLLADFLAGLIAQLVDPRLRRAVERPLA
jgi:ABC-type dipeptide/oligopeptide/nickel transport system permease component